MARIEWDELKNVLGRALELPRADRERYLETECGDSDREELRAEVESLLRHHDAASGSSSSPPSRLSRARRTH